MNCELWHNRHQDSRLNLKEEKCKPKHLKKRCPAVFKLVIVTQNSQLYVQIFETRKPTIIVWISSNGKFRHIFKRSLAHIVEETVEKIENVFPWFCYALIYDGAVLTNIVKRHKYSKASIYYYINASQPQICNKVESSGC